MGLAKLENDLFIVAGMPRGGTTFLYHNLQKHPQIFLPSRKEVTFFTSQWESKIDWYEKMYEGIKPNQKRGDISPPLFHEPESYLRIKEYKEDAKVILTVRNPVQHALSQYAQIKTFTVNMPSFEEFITKGYSYESGNGIVTARFLDGYIVKMIRNYMNEFGESVLLYDFNEFNNNTEVILQTIEKFLGLDRFFIKGNYDDMKINATDRANNVFLSWLLQDERVIKMIMALFPRKLTMKARAYFDKTSAKKLSDKKYYTDEDKQLAKELLADQEKEIAELFTASKTILGTGEAFEL